MSYPRTVKLESEKLKKLLLEKSDFITKGRAKSEEIEALEKELTEIDLKLQEEEKKVDISDLHEKEKSLTERVSQCVEEMNLIKKEIYDRMKAQVPSELHDKYDEIKKKKEELEGERNKIAIKAQKYNDKIIPLSRKLMKPLLEDSYEDYESIKFENGEIVATIFNHLEDFKTNFAKKNQ